MFGSLLRSILQPYSQMSPCRTPSLETSWHRRTVPLQEGSVVWVGSQTWGPHGVRARFMPGTNNHLSRVAKVLLVPIPLGLCGGLDHKIVARGSDPDSGTAALLGHLLEVATCGECTAVLINAFFLVMPHKLFTLTQSQGRCFLKKKKKKILFSYT